MNLSSATAFIFAFCTFGALGALPPPSFALSASPQQPQAGQSAVTKSIGTIKAINGNSLTLTPDAGPDVNVSVQALTRIRRIAPGETNLKNAICIELREL